MELSTPDIEGITGWQGRLDKTMVMEKSYIVGIFGCLNN